MFFGKYFPEILLVAVGHLAGGKDAVEIHVIFVARFGTFRPKMFIRCVIENQIHNQADARLTKFARKRCKLFHRAKRRMHFAITADRIAAIVFAFGRFEERHEMKIGEAEFLEIWDFGFHAFEVFCEKINVANSAQHLVRLEPERILLPCIVQFAQISGSCKPC